MGKVKKVVKKGIVAVVAPRYTAREVRRGLDRRRINLRRQGDYQRWFEKHKATDEELALQRTQALKLKLQPLVSILLPIYNTPEAYLRACIDSVLAQTYTNWELCIADDASPSDIIEVVKEYAAQYPNIKWVKLTQNQHIAMSSNAAMELADGEYIALLDHDDVLLPNALFEMVSAINDNPKADLLYSDEDKIEAGIGHLEPFFKPQWSPDFLRACNYITHFAVLRHAILKDIGGFRYGTEGAQDWDLFLRFTKKTHNIVHVPKIIYSWRKSPTSTAKTAKSKPYAYVNQRRVLRESLRDNPIAASVHDHASLGFWRVRYHIQTQPRVSIIIPTKDSYELIKQCLESIVENTSYPNFEVVVVDTGSTDQAVQELYESKLVKGNDIKLFTWSKKFNFSAVCNYGATKASGDYLLFLNNDTQVISSDWIEGLLEHAQRPDVGMVGCKLLFPNGRIQHAGVVLSERDIAFHPFYGEDPRQDIFTHIYTANIRECAAVTAACSMVSRKKFDAVGGFDETLRVTYNDVDLNLKLLKAGLRNIYTPFVELYHHESMSVGRITGGSRDKTELEKASDIMRSRWGSTYLKRDPYYNENFMQHGPGYDFDV
jgi:glycosyltransferase involved in cell wall biosynthesis